MPISAVAYTSKEAFDDLANVLKARFADRKIKPYTLSLPQKQATGDVRFRATELIPGVLIPLLSDMVEKKATSLASSADREVRQVAYEDLLRDADRSRTKLTVQYVSPIIVPVVGERSPFPVVPTVIAGYGKIWDAFSDIGLPRPAVDIARSIRVADFKISCAVTSFGTGCQGWVTLEMARGRTEEEIGIMNALIDFAFYCGTGLHTEDGLGQTRRTAPRQP